MQSDSCRAQVEKNKKNQTYVPLGMSQNIPFGHVHMQQHYRTNSLTELHR